MTEIAAKSKLDSLVDQILKEIEKLELEHRENALSRIVNTLEQNRKGVYLTVKKLCGTAPTSVPERVQTVFLYAFSHDKVKCQKALNDALANYSEVSPDKSRIVKLIGQLTQKVEDDLARRLVIGSLLEAGYESYF